MKKRIKDIINWFHPDIGERGFNEYLETQALTAVKMLGIILFLIAVFSQALLRILYYAESSKTQQGNLISKKFFILSAALFIALKMPFIKKICSYFLLAVIFFIISDNLVLQLSLFAIHKAQLGLFISALCFIAFTFMPYRPWIIGMFGIFGIIVILSFSYYYNLDLNPYTNTGIFWLMAQFFSLSLITMFFRSAILNMQLNIFRSGHRILSMQEDLEDIKSILSKTEGHKLEYKSSFRYDYKQNKANTDLSVIVLKTIAGFLNSDGGALIIGIDDNNKILGLEKDYQTLKKKNSDGYQLAIVQAISESIGAEVCQSLRFSFMKIEEKEICLIHITPFSDPVYIELNNQTHFYIRTGNSTQELDTKRAVEYIRAHWKNINAR